MAKLDTILLKTSVESREELIKTMLGTNPNVELPTKIEVGELIIRRDTESDVVELWSLNAKNEPTQVSVDIAGMIPDFDPDDLSVAELDDIGDVDYRDGNPQGLSSGQAGYVLTWDGTKWVVRPQAALEFDGGVIPSLNYIGDVNYSHYADGFPTTNDEGKFLPAEGDTLWWQYNYNTSQYEWAPIPLRIEYLHDISLGGTGSLPGTSERWIVFNPSRYNALTFGNGKRGIWDQTTGVRIGSNYHHLGNSSGSWTWYMKQGVRLSYRGDSGQTNSPIESGIYYDEQSFPSTPPSEYHLITLKHVREDWGNHSIGELNDVDTTGVLQGQVLVWNSLNGQWEPGSGPAPDFSGGSIGDLADMELDNVQDRQGLFYDLADRKFKNEWPKAIDVIPHYCDSRDREEDCPDCYCKPCNGDNLGRILVRDNVPYVCLEKRCSSGSNSNGCYGYIRLLHDGWNSFGTTQNRPSGTGYGRTDPLSQVAYQGQLGDLYNVSTADVFHGAAVVYDVNAGKFIMGYPALDLTENSVGELNDVCAEGAGIGYGLLWNGSCWEASSLEQKIRLDDLQDVQFGDLGITNDKLVAAFMLVDGQQRQELKAEQDLSPSLAVSTPKADAGLGSTLLATNAPTNPRYTTARWFGVFENWTLAQKLDAYVRWNHDPSWQTIDGDGCIELWFYPDTLLDNRTLFRKEAIQANAGGYILRLNENGSLYFSVSGAEGASGFSITTPINFVSMNNWHHVAVTRQGNINRLYLDGSKVGQKESVAAWTGDGKFTLGRNDLDDNNALTHDFFKGLMQDFRVTKGRPKYDGENYTQPIGLEAELIDTTPQAGDFLSYNGTYWTNVGGVTADISSNSITELIDVDTTSKNPDTGDALVWTGEQWEPGIPGIGATWSLDDMTDVSTDYQASHPWVRFDQSEALLFSNTFIEERDHSWISHQRGTSTRMSFEDGSYTCDPYDPTSDGPYSSSHHTYFDAQRFGVTAIRSMRTTLKNGYSNCRFPPESFHLPALAYEYLPGTGTGQGSAAYTESTFIPAVGNIEAIMPHLLGFGDLGHLSNVTVPNPVNGEALIYRDGEWIASSEIAADISQNSINDLGDVEVAGATDDQVLTYDEANRIWVPTTRTASLDDFPEFGFLPVSGSSPVNLTHTYSPNLTTNGQDGSPSGDHVPNASNVMDLEPTGIRGLHFYTGDYQRTHAGLHTIKTTSHESLLLYVSSYGTGSFEINPYYFRFANSHGTGGSGVRFADGLRGVYETTVDWDNYASNELVPKSAILEKIQDQAANLDLSLYSIDDLGDVDSTGKGQGWALTWDIESATWVATDGVAANLQLSSIGELKDVEKQPNTDVDTNDGWVSFDIGELRTSRPQQATGGLIIPNQALDSRYGWSAEGKPRISDDSGLGSSIELQENQVEIDANAGAVYVNHPALGDYTIPSWLQVQQQIARQQTDFIATFLLTGNSLTEEIHNWPLDLQMTTVPNPAYFSKFGGEWSLNFQRGSQDKILWQHANGAPEHWPKEKLYSFEFWLWVDSADPNTENTMEYVVAPVASAGEDGTGYTYSTSSNGIHIGLTGDRTRIFATLGTCSSGGQQPSSTWGAGTVTQNAWNHVYFAHEGEGRMRLFVNGVRTASWTWSSPIVQNNGFAFGGRNNGNTGDPDTYLSGFLDDLRITESWLPYPVDQTTIPVPVEPLTGEAWTYKYGTLDQLTDVQGTDDAIHGQALIYNAIDEVWEPGDAPGYDVSSNSLSDLADADTSNSTPDDDDVLRWNGDTDVWERSKIDGNGGIRPLNARSATPGAVPSVGNIFAGELFLNMADRTLWALDSAGQPFMFANGDLEDKINEIDRVVGGDF